VSQKSFLGYKISFLGLQLLPEQVAGQACPPPKTVSQLLSVLNFYQHFLPHTTSIQSPLHDVLSGPKVKGSHPITWTTAFITAFEERKASLS